MKLLGSVGGRRIQKSLNKSDLVLSRQWLKNYDDNVKEMHYLRQKMRQKKESLNFMYSRTNSSEVRAANRVHEAGENKLHHTFDSIEEIENRLIALGSEQERAMSLIDEFVDRDCALVIRSYHELGLNFTEIGKLYHMGRSTANRRYWRGMEILEEALQKHADLAA